MADDRPLEEPPEQVGRLEQDLADLRAMVNARLARRPTGDMEISFRPTPKDNTLVCNGQAVSRTTYADLFQWATDQGLFGVWFGNGDGSTTFTIPDFRDRFPVGAGGSLALGATGGAASRALTATELPAHAHTASASIPAHAAHDHTFSGSGSATGSAGGHTHGFTTSSDGNHGGHTSGTSNVTQSGSGVTLPSNYSGGGGTHSHSGGTDNQGNHTHSVNVNGDVGQAGAMSHSPTVTVNSAGSGGAFDQRPPFAAVSVLLWT